LAKVKTSNIYGARYEKVAKYEKIHHLSLY